MTSQGPDRESLRASRRALLKGAVAAGVGLGVYSTPVVSVVPAYGQTSLVSYTKQSRVICVWFSPNQESYGQWHHNETGYTDVKNNYDPYTGVMGGTASWGCFPPAMRVGVQVDGTTRWVTFVGVPDDALWTQSATATCTSGGTTVPQYTLVNATTQWSGGGIRITVEDANCEMVVTGQGLSGDGRLLTLGPYCNPQSNYCDATNDNAAPATWAQGSSLSPIGAAGCEFLDTSPSAPPACATTTGSAPNGNVGGGVFSGTAYYHSGRTGRGQGDRCKWALLFVIRCR